MIQLCDLLALQDLESNKNGNIVYFMTESHWCINSIYNEFAIAIDCTLKVVPFVSVLFKSCLFSESLFGYLEEVTKIGLQRLAAFFRIQAQLSDSFELVVS